VIRRTIRIISYRSKRKRTNCVGLLFRTRPSSRTISRRSWSNSCKKITRISTEYWYWRNNSSWNSSS